MAAEEDSTEVSVASVYCVVYRLENADWVVTGEGWSQVHLYRDEADSTYRLVGWTVSDFKIVVNANVLAGCKYKKKSADFHKFTDEAGVVFGFGFYKKAESIQESEEFMDAVLAAVRSCSPDEASPAEPAAAAAAAAAPETRSGSGTVVDRIQSLSRASGSEVKTTRHAKQPSDTGPLAAPYNHSRESKVMENIGSASPSRNGVVLGELPIMPAKSQRRPSAVPPPLPPRDGPREITDPTKVVHLTSVRYDPASRSYQGLPPEWQRELARQFGLPPNKVETIKLERYASRIPAVLVQMKEYLFKHGGLEVEGIFRLAPDADESALVKKQLNEGSFESCRDINCIANLIKVWLREMPEHLLDHVDRTKVENAVSNDDAGAVVAGMQEPYKSVMEWLLDMCVEVSQHKAVNLMSAKNLAIVIVPNLFTPSNDNPMKALLYSQKCAQFMYKAVEHRAENFF